jgi:hypothetical protein
MTNDQTPRAIPRWSVRVWTWSGAEERPPNLAGGSPADLIDTPMGEPEGSAGYRIRVEAPPAAARALVVEGAIEGAESGFAPGVLVVEDALHVFLGGGREVRCYALEEGTWRLEWLRQTDVGFWRWARHGNIVLMLAELEIVAWDTTGVLRWTLLVEPPWSYRIDLGVLEVLTDTWATRFPIDRGPAARLEMN